jgi:amino acid transporter
MGFNATWSMAVGGMVGGGIFSVLGVVIQLAGDWAWLSFVLAGLIALVTGYSYVGLARMFGEGGGAFTFLREAGRDSFAGSLSWVLILGYVLTLSLYAYTFGSYLGVGQASGVEVVTVWAKLAVLVGLASIGLWRFQPDAMPIRLLHGQRPGGAARRSAELAELVGRHRGGRRHGHPRRAAGSRAARGAGGAGGGGAAGRVRPPMAPEPRRSGSGRR